MSLAGAANIPIRSAVTKRVRQPIYDREYLFNSCMGLNFFQNSVGQCFSTVPPGRNFSKTQADTNLLQCGQLCYPNSHATDAVAITLDPDAGEEARIAVATNGLMEFFVGSRPMLVLPLRLLSSFQRTRKQSDAMTMILLKMRMDMAAGVLTDPQTIEEAKSLVDEIEPLYRGSWPLGGVVNIRASEYFQVRLQFVPAIKLDVMCGITCFLEGEMESPA
jgi:hypothetical protein